MSKRNKEKELICPITFFEPLERVHVDEWIPEAADMWFTTIKGAIRMDVSSFYNVPENPDLDSFYLKPKRSYNSEKERNHIVHYLNYFLRYYDHTKELPSIYATIKYLIDYEPTYTKDAFFYDLRRYIINGNMAFYADQMNEDNYSLSLTYRNKNNPVLQYLDRHAKLLMKISLLMIMIIPLLCHYMTSRQIKNTTEFLLEIYDDLLHIDPSIDIYSKLYETAETNVEKAAKNNHGIFSKQDIRGVNVSTHTANCVTNIILNIIPKYIYADNLIHLNFGSINKNTGFKILDIEYEYNYFSLSSSNRDADLNSEFDKFESYLQKADTALYIQHKVACESSMQFIDMLYGPFDEDEIAFYIRRLSDNGVVTVNSFQKDFVFNLFYKYFGDPDTMNMIGVVDYVKLIIAARRILEQSGMVLLPHIISSKVLRIASRKNINKKELTKLEMSPLYEEIKNKYRNEKMTKHILSLISTTMSSDFECVDMNDDDLNGIRIQVIPELILEEIPLYITMI